MGDAELNKGGPCSSSASQVQSTKASLFQIVKQPVLTAATVFCWLQTWWSMCENAAALLFGAVYDNRFAISLVILVFGLVATNTLGFLNFYVEGQFKAACAASVDLDMVYLRVTMRNAVWRSLPLACINMFLVTRSYLTEIPVCQMTLSPKCLLQHCEAQITCQDWSKSH